MRNRDSLHIPWAFSLNEAPRLPLTGDQHPLRREFGKWLSWGNLTALLVGFALFTAWQLYSNRPQPAPVAREIKIVRYTELGVPPSIARPSVPQIKIAEAVAQAIAPPRIAIPEPVADEKATTQTIATVNEIKEALEPITMEDLGAGGVGDSLVIDVDIDTSPAPDEFVPVEEEPVRIRIDPPIYPEMARNAEVEGTVLVRALVGKDGKIKDALVIDGVAMLHDAALACARTALFKPAMSQNQPVEVWVMIPVTFRLR